jgi:hypothetical protein
MRARIGGSALVAVVLTAGVCGDAAAKTHDKQHLNAQRRVAESRAQLIPQYQVRLGAMRYYGGPKSPMWREVR